MFCVTDVNPPWPFNNWSKHGLARRCARLLAPPSRRSTGNLLIVSHRRLAGAGKVLISPNCVFDASLVPETCLEFPSLPE